LRSANRPASRNRDGEAELIEELADVQEVVLALMSIHGLRREDIESRRLEKRAQYGAFDGRIYNEAIEVNEDNPATSYYLPRPDKYPRS
jgi:hypothetical protein